MIIATAGHVDHGKTRLVQALTGVDTDTLAEEKKRGLSIDLGFAHLPLAPGRSIGFIDVPGHQRFIRNALCGLAAADFLLLLVAADDGPMPQTREHLALIDLLGYRRGAIVVSKIDRVDSGRVAAVMRELDALLRPTLAADWPRHALSAESGAGVEALRARLLQEANEPSRKAGDEAASANLRMPIDRCFVVKGSGTVVTGTLFAGCLRRNDEITIAGTGMRLRARALRVHDREVESALPGQRCAINLAGASLRKDLIRRGSWVTSPEVAAPVTRFDAEIRLVDDCAQPLRHWTPVHLHLAAAQTTARVAMLHGAALAAGRSGLVQLVSDQPLGAAFGDRLVLRDHSARMTLGGGRVLDIFAPRRGRARPQRIDWLRQMKNTEATAALRALLSTSHVGVDLEQFALNRNLGSAARDEVMRRCDMIVLRPAGRRTGFSPASAEALQTAVLAALQCRHRELPGAAGFSREQLRARLPVRISQALLQAVIEHLQRQNRVEIGGAGIALPGRDPLPRGAAAAHWRGIESALAANGLRPMSIAELERATGLTAAQLKPLLQRLRRAGRVVKLSPTLLLLPRALGELQQLLTRLQARTADGLFSVADFRDASGIGRNRCIEILEGFDARGITRRRGGARQLLPAAAHAFAQLQPAMDE